MTAIVKRIDHGDQFAIRGDYAIHAVDYRHELRAAIEHLRRMEARQLAPIPEEERRRIFLAAVPCLYMEHRHGVCPLGLDHRIRDSEGHNTIVRSLKGSVVKQFAKKATPLDLGCDYIACGTSSAATQATDTALGAEYYRDTPTYLDTTSDLQAVAFFYFGPDRMMSPSDLQEWGIFSGDATAAANSGTMVARFLSQKSTPYPTAINGSYYFNIA